MNIQELKTRTLCRKENAKDAAPEKDFPVAVSASECGCKVGSSSALKHSLRKDYVPHFRSKPAPPAGREIHAASVIRHVAGRIAAVATRNDAMVRFDHYAQATRLRRAAIADERLYRPV